MLKNQFSGPSRSLMLQCSDEAGTCILESDGADHGFLFADPNAQSLTLDRVLIRNFYAPTSAAPVLAASAELTVTDCLFESYIILVTGNIPHIKMRFGDPVIILIGETKKNILRCCLYRPTRRKTCTPISPT